MHTVDFSVIINMFSMEGMVALGKMKHPVLDTMEKNLDQAKFIIDLIGVLQEKSKGNLTSSEERLIEYTLSNLRLNYVQETNAITEVSAARPASDASGVA